MQIFLAWEAIPKGSLNAAVGHLIKNVSTKVLGKRKFEEDDGVAAEDGIELLCNMFNRLHQGEWFDGWHEDVR